MKKSEEAILLYSLAAYFGASLLATSLLLLGALFVIKFLFILSGFAFGPGGVYLVKPLPYDSAGFAFASAGTALAQYYLVGLLRCFVEKRSLLLIIVSFTALLCGLYFWRGVFFSSLGAYGYSGLAVTLAALLGGFEAAFQAPDKNQRPAAISSYFK
jgi:hypothetical protein